MRPPELSVVIPFRDEAPALLQLHRELSEALDRIGLVAETIFVDDDSRDEGALVVRDLAARDPRIRLLTLSAHAGQTAALEAGIRAARGGLVATLDADGQNDPADLPGLVAALGEGIDAVCGVRVNRCDTWRKRWASKVANRVRRWVLGDHFRDGGCNLRILRTEPLRRVRLFRGAHRFLPVLLELEGARVIEHPVGHRPRSSGASKYAVLDRLRESAVDLLGVAWLARRRMPVEAKEWTRAR